MKKLSLLGIIMTLSAGVSFGAIPVAPINQWVSIINQYSGLCLDVPGWSGDNGQPMQQWSCTGGSNQHFMLIPVNANAPGGPYQILIQSDNLSLDITAVSPDPGALVQQWQYLGGRNQQFWVIGNSGGYPSFKIQAVNSGLCLDLTALSFDNGLRIQQWGCYASQGNQNWYLQ